MNKPWTKQYDPWCRDTLPYPELTLYETVAATAERLPDYPALTFLGRQINYTRLLDQIEKVGRALSGCGLKKGDVVTICLPNIPQAVIFFYAANRQGLICNMVHPLTPAVELEYFMQFTSSKMLIILDAFLEEHRSFLDKDEKTQVIVCSIMDYLKIPMKLGFYLTKGRRIKPVPHLAQYRTWRSFFDSGKGQPQPYRRQISPDECAVYLQSGGTTGTPKTVMLSAANFNVLAVQGPQLIGSPVDENFDPAGLSMVSILPLFHGFGLCMGVHTMLLNGIRCILVPQFTPDVLADVIIREKPTFLAGVPTLFEGMLKNKKMQKADLSCLQAVFSGGDTLSSDLKERFDQFITSRNGRVTLREGYGLTETVTVCCVNPMLRPRADCIGLPLADILMKIVDPETGIPLPAGEDGEICVHGPTMMLGYLKDDAASAQTIRRHADGLDWVHTGDLGSMDQDGFFFFKQRLKRIIKVSGVPVFPSQIENVIAAVPGVRLVCAIGVPDPYKMQVVKVFVAVDETVKDYDLMREKILAQAEKSLLRYAVPKEIEFRKSLPLTKVGKVDFIALERGELAKNSGQSRA